MLKRKRAAAELAMYFAEKGYIPAARDYNQDLERPRHLKLSRVRTLFRTYSGMVKIVQGYEPELMAGLTSKKPEPKPVEQPVVKPAKAAKEAEKEGANGEDI